MQIVEVKLFAAVCSVGYYFATDGFVDPVTTPTDACTKCPAGATTKTVGSKLITECGKIQKQLL